MNPIPEKKKSRNNMLPLMDMVFLLLVLFIFMLIQMRPDFGISVNLPEVDKATTPKEDEKPKKRVAISVTSDNIVYVDKAECAVADVGDIVASSHAKDEEVEVVLKGDKVADYGIILNVFHELRSTGVSNILFDVEYHTNKL